MLATRNDKESMFKPRNNLARKGPIEDPQMKEEMFSTYDSHEHQSIKPH
jgi:hypothetical protein